MIFISGGEFVMGREHGRPDERPARQVRISAFCLDETLVTYAAFRRFADDKHYVSTAETRGYGMVAFEGLPNWKWIKTPGATWRQPFGSERAKRIPMHDDYPVVSVSWADASSYCQAMGKRLPTEAEWEYAARAGSSSRYPWGDSPRLPNGRYGLNFWQGKSHTKNDREDGYTYLSPVKAFPPNRWGMYDPAGNVWQWTNDWYGPDTFRKIASGGNLDPQGPPTGEKKVARGGSWWCSEATCHGFGLYYRGKAHPRAVFNNNGFRCARSLGQ